MVARRLARVLRRVLGNKLTPRCPMCRSRIVQRQAHLRQCIYCLHEWEATLDPEEIQEADALETFESEPDLQQIPELFDSDAHRIGAAYLLGFNAGWHAHVVEVGLNGGTG